MEGRKCPVIYFCGTGKVKNVWFRVYFDSNDKSNKRKKIYPVAESTSFKIGSKDGSWAVVGDDIYWVGGNSSSLGWQRCLLKHNAENPYDTTCWALESQVRKLPRAMPSVLAIDRKIYLLGGTEHDHPNVDWTKGCGEVYDLDGRTWEYLNIPDMPPIGAYDTCKVTVKEDGETTRVVFYSLLEGSVLFLDVTSGKFRTSEGHDSFAWNRPLLCTPKGLEDCEDNDLDVLYNVTRNIRAVFKDDTFYWISYDLCLYGYDVNLRRWFRSPSIKEKLGTLKLSMGSSECPNCPVLVGLPDGKFVMIITEEPGELTMASLGVDREDESLSVSVECIQGYSFDYPSFVPYDGMAILKNVGTGSMAEMEAKWLLRSKGGGGVSLAGA